MSNIKDQLKNQLIKAHEATLKETQKFLEHSLEFNNWAMETNRKYMQLEQSLWHREWKVSYLEKKLKAIKLYEEDIHYEKKK